jgi:hypothetical protein
MKAWEYSGIKSFFRDEHYNLPKEEAKKLSELTDPKKENKLGALKYFMPADDEARAFYAELTRGPADALFGKGGK